MLPKKELKDKYNVIKWKCYVNSNKIIEDQELTGNAWVM